MIDVELIGWFALAAAGLGGSALWSGLETALYAVHPVTLSSAAARGDKAARRVQAEIRRPDRTLTTVLIGNNTSNYLGTLGLTGALEHLAFSPGLQITLQILILSPMLLVFGEVLPKDLMRLGAFGWAKRLVPMLRLTRWLATLTGALPVILALAWMLKKVVGVGGTVTEMSNRERLLSMFHESVGEGGVSRTQAAMAARALAFAEATVETISERLDEAVMLNQSDVLDVARSTISGIRTARVGVRGAQGAIVGVVTANALRVAPSGTTVESLMGSVATVRVDDSLRNALAIMRQAKTAMAVVHDREGQPVGLVTIEQALAPLIDAKRPSSLPMRE